ncbi:sugar/nucleoside kinase (ribokinase family) [Polymorphobacter multimanifer]|uniref:Sugar/nucleoside kinase (Ribokinase family) n=1 Tax=Polymorphobacter multimanifer TaxID=1070431 RepID=A0A841L217_9SPHN|nr:adenosine kinase [Polymorphobacter multimanifer]MBB6226849.1 sugar/nucleoside kinase (ribokinase family) [Polymorphobacter multimanifer]
MSSTAPAPHSTAPRFDVIAIGNAIVDVITAAPPSFLAERDIAKGSMRLISAEEAEALYAVMGSGREISGGSAANTVAGVAALGARPAFVGRVAQDQLGQVFTHDIRAAGVHFETPASANGNPTGRCLIVVTPDGDRTMNTYLGACQELSEADLDAATVAASGILYLEGYLWDPPAPRAAMKKAIEVARANGRKVAFTLSDVFCVEGHREDFQDLLASHVDLMFANENEARALYQTDDLGVAMAEMAKHACITVITRSEKGAVVLAGGEVHEVPAEPATRVLDTTGAGDLFAGGFMAGMVQGRSLPDCARIGCIAAAEVISHYGARPEADLRALVAARI